MAGLVPVPVQPPGGKGVVEGAAVQLLGFGPRAVQVEDQGGQRHASAASAAARMARMLSP